MSFAWALPRVPQARSRRVRGAGAAIGRVASTRRVAFPRGAGSPLRSRRAPDLWRRRRLPRFLRRAADPDAAVRVALVGSPWRDNAPPPCLPVAHPRGPPSRRHVPPSLGGRGQQQRKRQQHLSASGGGGGSPRGGEEDRAEVAALAGRPAGRSVAKHAAVNHLHVTVLHDTLVCMALCFPPLRQRGCFASPAVTGPVFCGHRYAIFRLHGCPPCLPVRSFCSGRSCDRSRTSRFSHVDPESAREKQGDDSSRLSLKFCVSCLECYAPGSFTYGPKYSFHL